MTLYQRLLTEKHIEADLNWAESARWKAVKPFVRPHNAEQRLMTLTQPLRSL